MRFIQLVSGRLDGLLFNYSISSFDEGEISYAIRQRLAT